MDTRGVGYGVGLGWEGGWSLDVVSMALVVFLLCMLVCVGGWHGLWVQTHIQYKGQCSQGQGFNSLRCALCNEDLRVKLHHPIVQCSRLGFRKDLGIGINYEICVVIA
jgi:hypothetical protein